MKPKIKLKRKKTLNRIRNEEANNIINHDGFHSGVDRHGNQVTRSGQVALEQGYHPLKINYFDWGSGEYLKVFVEGSGIEYQEVSPEMLFH